MPEKIHVDWDLCESYGVCVSAAPDVFDLDDEDSLIVLKEHPAEHQMPGVRDAIRRCPKKALFLTTSEETVS